MFNNPGMLIKKLAQIMFWLEAIAALITGLALISDLEGYAAIIIFGGILSAWLIGLFVYAFGELVEKATSIDDKMDKKSAPVQPVKEVEDLPEI